MIPNHLALTNYLKYDFKPNSEGKEPSGYLIKWGEKEEHLKQDARSFHIPVEDETALLVTLQTMGENVLEYETLVKLRCSELDKQKEEALILILVIYS